MRNTALQLSAALLHLTVPYADGSLVGDGVMKKYKIQFDYEFVI